MGKINSKFTENEMQRTNEYKERFSTARSQGNKIKHKKLAFLAIRLKKQDQ